MENKNKNLVDNENLKTEIDDINESNTDDNNKDWEFDAVAHTLDNELSLDEKFSVKINEDDESDSDDCIVDDELNEEEAEDDADDSNKNDLEEQEDSSHSKKKKPISKESVILTTILCVLLAVAIAFFGYIMLTKPNTDERMNPGNVALTVGSTKVSIGMYNYCYNGTVNRVLNAHSAEIKPDVPFSQQTTLNEDGKEVTFEQYFKDETIFYLKSMIACYEAGKEAGIELTPQQQADIDEEVANIKKTAVDNDEGINEYTQKNFGEYCGLATIEKYLIQQTIANEYKNRYFVETSYSKDECQKYFDDNISTFQQIPIGFLIIPYEKDNEGSKDKVIADAKKYCEGITNVDKLKDLVPIVYKDLIDQNVKLGYYKNADIATEELKKVVEAKIDMGSKDFNEEIKNWVFSSDTKVNDCKYFVDEFYDCVFIVLKTGKPTINKAFYDDVYAVRHILIKPTHTDEKDKNEKYTEEEWNLAKKQAQEIYDDFKAGDKTEISFAKLAEEYSDDTESTSKGQSGLYGGIIDNCPVGSTVKEFETWAIDKNRKYGDTGIVKTKFGYHIMFFKSYEPIYLSISNSEKAYKGLENRIDSYKVVEHKNAMKKTKVAKISDFPKTSDFQ